MENTQYISTLNTVLPADFGNGRIVNPFYYWNTKRHHDDSVDHTLVDMNMNYCIPPLPTSPSPPPPPPSPSPPPPSPSPPPPPSPSPPPSVVCLHFWKFWRWVPSFCVRPYGAQDPCLQPDGLQC